MAGSLTFNVSKKTFSRLSTIEGRRVGKFSAAKEKREEKTKISHLALCFYLSYVL